jgi:hypothetical protein
MPSTPEKKKSWSRPKHRRCSVLRAGAKKGKTAESAREAAVAAADSSLQARGWDRQWLQLLVMMKNCWLSLGVSSAALLLVQTAMAKRTERRWMEWMDWTGWRGLSGRSDADGALQKRIDWI